ncbi:GFA family protein [Albimonas pacifica]|uniref:Uncharacterized conserved protein n=1 Tax=Albimonas pacifica TaxID=1114924 RepID=A0A1I3MFB0_9RHOB|nr:GFA family protein [Albimonas pacifica]SFI95405.1 Uncharacterized conserved protein [Albimonas pacifica]
MILTGGCLCGGVRWRVESDPVPVVACYCEDCRRTTGNHVACATFPAGAVTIEETTLRWYASSAEGRRGFCRTCGGNLFWTATDWDRLEIWMGTADMPTGLRLSAHEFTASAADWDAIPPDGLPRFERIAPGEVAGR